MSSIVLDASLAVAWLLREDLEQPAVSALGHFTQEGAYVPPLWHYEVRNALLVAERRGRIPGGGAKEGLEALVDLQLLTDQATNLDDTLDLAFSHQLSFYDALYLELARRRGLPLGTRDAALARAAQAEGLEAMGR